MLPQPTSAPRETRPTARAILFMEDPDCERRADAKMPKNQPPQPFWRARRLIIVSLTFVSGRAALLRLNLGLGRMIVLRRLGRLGIFGRRARVLERSLRSCGFG